MSLMFKVFPRKCKHECEVYVEEEVVYDGVTLQKYVNPLLEPSDVKMTDGERCFARLRPAQVHRMCMDGEELMMDTVHGLYRLQHAPRPADAAVWMSDSVQIRKLLAENKALTVENHTLRMERRGLGKENNILSTSLRNTEMDRVALEVQLVLAGASSGRRVRARTGSDEL